MKIGFVLCEHPVDVRIKKEARSLAAAGHSVVGIVRAQDMNQRVTEVDALTVETYVRGRESAAEKLRTFISMMLLLPVPVEELVERFAVDNKVDVLHAHDLPNVGTALRVGRKLGLPVVADLHEYYPAAVRARVGDRFKPHHWLTTNQTIWHSFERRCVERSDRVIVVVEENRDRIARYGIDPNKIYVAPNYVDMAYLRAFGNGTKAPAQYSDKFVISYIGGIAPHRGIDVAVRAFVAVSAAAPDALLLVIGNESDYSEYIRSLIVSLGVQDSVELLGWQPFERVPDLVEASNVGLIPHQRNPHCDHTIPNKMFDYMGFGKPIIVSDCPPMKRIVNDAQAGLVFRADSTESLAEQIVRLHEDRALGDKLGANGAAAVSSRYNWDAAASELVRLYGGGLRNR